MWVCEHLRETIFREWCTLEEWVIARVSQVDCLPHIPILLPIVRRWSKSLMGLLQRHYIIPLTLWWSPSITLPRSWYTQVRTLVVEDDGTMALTRPLFPRCHQWFIGKYLYGLDPDLSAVVVETKSFVGSVLLEEGVSTLFVQHNDVLTWERLRPPPTSLRRADIQSFYSLSAPMHITEVYVQHQAHRRVLLQNGLPPQVHTLYINPALYFSSHEILTLPHIRRVVFCHVRKDQTHQIGSILTRQRVNWLDKLPNLTHVDIRTAMPLIHFRPQRYEVTVDAKELENQWLDIRYGFPKDDFYCAAENVRIYPFASTELEGLSLLSRLVKMEYVIVKH